MDARFDYRRAVAVLAGRDRRTDPLAYVTRAARRVCGAAIAALLGISPIDATLEVLRVHGSSAAVVAPHLAALGPARLSAMIRPIEVAGYRILAVSVVTPSGIAGVLAVGVRPPDRFALRCRQHLRDLASIASVAVQLAASRPASRLPRVLGDGYRPLSRREREVVALLLNGASVKEAAARLMLSPRTVETYLQRLKQRERQPRLRALLAQLVRTGRA